MTFMLEIHSVTITLDGDNNIVGREIYGVVEATDSEGTVYIYKAGKDTCKPVLEDRTLYLTGPNRPITQCSQLRVCLKDKQTGIVVSSGYYYMPNFFSLEWFDKPIGLSFIGTHGQAILRATIFSSGSGVAIAVDVTLFMNTEGPQNKKAKNSGVEDNPKSRHAIHGTLYARVGGEKECYRRTLFNRSSDHPMSVVNVNVIRLSRHIIVVPKHSTVFIDAQLWDETQVEIANGPLHFKDKVDDMGKREISDEQGDIGCIKVKVTWLSDEN